MREYLVTAQGYYLGDLYKQTILIHDCFFAKDSKEAETMFNDQFKKDYHIMNIYSIMDVTHS